MSLFTDLVRPSARFRDFVRENPVARRMATKAIRTLSQAVATRSYEAARASRRTEGWFSSNQHPNSLIAGSLSVLRRESSAMERDNTLGHRYCYTMANNIAGTGPAPSATTGDTGLDERINKLWQTHATRINADGTRLGAEAMMWQGVFAWIERGSALLLRRPMLSSDGLTIPLTIELMEGDMLDHSLNKSNKDGSRIVNGVELDARHRVTAYHLFKQHPSDFLGNTALYDHTRVLAEDVAHLYLATRPGQRQGIPFMAASLMALHDLDDYRLFERVRKKIESSLTAFVMGGDDLPYPDDGRTITNCAVDSKGNKIETFEPGLIAYLPQGKSVEINRPQGVGGYNEYITTELTTIAAGLLIPYVVLTGDLSKANYSSIRAGMLEYHRLIKVLRKLFFVPLFCQPMWDWTMEAAYMMGLVPAREIPCEWTTGRFESVDPLKEANADAMDLKIGKRSLRAIIAETGRDPDDVLKEMAATNAQLKHLGLSFEWQKGSGAEPVVISDDDEDDEDDEKNEDKENDE